MKWLCNCRGPSSIASARKVHAFRSSNPLEKSICGLVSLGDMTTVVDVDGINPYDGCKIYILSQKSRARYEK